MRRMIVTALALSPALLFAQAIVPAQSNGNVPALQSKLAAPKPLGSLAEADRNTATTTRPISTGVIAPKLVHTIAIPAETNVQWRTAGKYRSAVVAMVVDETGKPSELKIVQSAGSDLDTDVLNAVRQYRFEPATVSSKPTAMPVDLTVNVLNPLAR